MAAIINCQMCVAVVVTLLVVGTVFCQSPCCGPDQWQGSIVGTTGEYNRDEDAASLAYSQSAIFYDYTNRQVALKRHVQNDTAHQEYDDWIIIKYDKGVRYRITGENCTKSDDVMPMEPPCIPKDAAYFGRHAYPRNVSIDVWFIKNEMGGGTTRLGVASESCLKVSSSRITGGPDYVLTMNIYENVTKGISDPSVFVVPPFCPQLNKTDLKFEPRE